MREKPILLDPTVVDPLEQGVPCVRHILRPVPPEVHDRLAWCKASKDHVQKVEWLTFGISDGDVDDPF